MNKLSLVISILLIGFLNNSITQEINLFVKVKKGKYGYVNEKGKKVIDYEYTYAEPFSEGLAVVEKDLKFGYIDKTGEIKISLEYFDAGSFSEGLAYISKNFKYGFINTEGKVVIGLEYDYAEDFINGYAIVRKINPNNDLYGRVDFIHGLINIKNELLANQWFSNITRKGKDSFEVSLGDETYSLSVNGKMAKNEKNASSSEKKNYFNNPGTETSTYHETLPEFNGGDKALSIYLSKNVRYPLSAQKYDIEGYVIVSFTITNSGSIENISVINPIHPILNKEALRVISEMPKWNPGTNDGKPIEMSFVLPINFKLN